MLSQSISSVNSKLTTTLSPVLFTDRILASWPGENLVINGEGPTNLSFGTNALNPHAGSVNSFKQPFDLFDPLNLLLLIDTMTPLNDRIDE